MHAVTHPSIVPSGIGLCDRCERRPAIREDEGGAICLVCEDNRNEALAEQRFIADMADGGSAPSGIAQLTHDAYRQRREAR